MRSDIALSEIFKDKVLTVTGGAGFIGSNFIRYMKKLVPSCKIVCFDKLTYAANLNNLAAETELCKLVKGDVASKNDVEMMIKKYAPDFIVNFAAESHVDRSIESAEIFCVTNTLGTLNLLECVLKYREKTGKSIRFHQISTDEVYGDLPITEEREAHKPFMETDRLMPSNPYAASKASADMFVLSYCRTYGLDAVITRSSNNYGKYQHPEKFIPYAIGLALEDKKITVYGDGKNQREWLYVDDHCRAVANVLAYGKAGEIYNIGSRNCLDNNTLAKLILKTLGKPEDKTEYIPDRKGHDRSYSMDCSKYRDTFGELPDTADFESTLESTILWYAERFSK